MRQTLRLKLPQLTVILIPPLCLPSGVKDFQKVYFLPRKNGLEAPFNTSESVRWSGLVLSLSRFGLRCLSDFGFSASVGGLKAPIR